jgi:lipoprotein-releasing system permease protein
MALIVVLSVMNGFTKEVRGKMLSVLSHAEIVSLTGALPDWQAVAAQARQNPEVIAAAPYVNAQAMLARSDVVRGALVRGIDPALEPKVSDATARLTSGALGDLVPGEFGIVLGVELARILGVARGEKVALIAPQGTTTPAGVVPRLRQFTVVGIVESGHFEYDSALALIHLADAEKMFRLDGPSGVRLKLADLDRAPAVARELARTLDPGVRVRDWSQMNRVYFAAVQTEKRMMFIILTLIVAVATFNLVSTLVMTVTEKQSDIAILRTLGASPRSVMAIFVVQGTIIGVLGTLLGVSLGLLVAANLDSVLALLERVFGFQVLPREIYFLSGLPSDPRAGDVVPIAVISLVLSFLATLYPSWRAARTRPAEALRYD